MKKLFTLFLVLATSIGTLFAQSGTCGNRLTWNLTNGVLTISGSGAMTNWYQSSLPPWYSYRENITSVIIDNNVTGIGTWAFEGCIGLTSVTIPNSATSIGSYAFDGCRSLTSVSIPNSINNIGPNAFYLVANINYSGTATGSPWGARSVNGYVDGFLVYNDSTKTSLLACSAAATGEISIPNSVTTIGVFAFYKCFGLTSVTIPNSVTDIKNYAFDGCRSLTNVTIPNNVTNIGNYAFRDCTGLTSVTIGSSVTGIGYYAFRDCTGLTSITCNADVPPTCVHSYAFFNVDRSIPVYVPDSSIELYKSADVWKEFNIVGISEALQAIEDVNATTNLGDTHKFFHNGQLYILRDGKTYTATGQEVR